VQKYLSDARQRDARVTPDVAIATLEVFVDGQVVHGAGVKDVLPGKGTDSQMAASVRLWLKEDPADRGCQILHDTIYQNS
jgi:hypothetical protein